MDRATLGPLAQAQVDRKLGASPPRKKKEPQPQDRSLENHLLMQLRALKLPKPEREFHFHPIRGWRFDLAWPPVFIAVEIDGGTWTNGGHVRGKHYESDCRKGCEAALLGWRVMHVTTDMIEDASAAEYIERLLKSLR